MLRRGESNWTLSIARYVPISYFVIIQTSYRLSL